MSRNSVLEEFNVNRLAVIQEDNVLQSILKMSNR